MEDQARDGGLCPGGWPMLGMDFWVMEWRSGPRMEVWGPDAGLDYWFEVWAPEWTSGPWIEGLVPGCRSEPQTGCLAPGLEVWAPDGDVGSGMESGPLMEV